MSTPQANKNTKKKAATATKNTKKTTTAAKKTEKATAPRATGRKNAKATEEPSGTTSGKAAARAALHRELERLAALRDKHGVVLAEDYEESLTRLGRAATPGAVGGLRKQLNAHHPAPPPASREFEMDEDAYLALAKARTLEEFHKSYVKVRHPGLHLSSFYRRFRRLVEPGLRAMLQPGRHGIESFRLAVLSCLWHAAVFGQVWQTDVVTLPCKAVPPGRGNNKRAVPVKLIAVIDDATRLIVAWGMVFCTGNRDVRAEDVASVLIGAMHRWGIPDQIVMDNGKEFDNSRISRLIKLAGNTARLTPRYRGESKGKIEAFNRQVNGWLHRCYTTWTQGPASSARYPLQGSSSRNAPNHEQVLEHLAELIDTYNTKKVHSAHGLTPLQAREADPTELRALTLHQVLHLAPVHNSGRDDQFVDVQGYGINHNTKYWTCLDPHSPGQGTLTGPQSLARLRGARHGVQIRPVNGDDTVIGVYDHKDRFICMATRMDCIPTDIKMKHSASKQAELRRAEQFLDKAHADIAAEYPDDDEQVDPAAHRAARTLAARIADILDLHHSQVTDRPDKVSAEDETLHHCRIITIDDPDTTFTPDTAIEVITAWTDKEAQAVYRVETPHQRLSYDPTRSAIRLITRATGEIACYIPIGFPTAA